MYIFFYYKSQYHRKISPKYSILNRREIYLFSMQLSETRVHNPVQGPGFSPWVLCRSLWHCPSLADQSCCMILPFLVCQKGKEGLHHKGSPLNMWKWTLLPLQPSVRRLGARLPARAQWCLRSVALRTRAEWKLGGSWQSVLQIKRFNVNLEKTNR